MSTPGTHTADDFENGLMQRLPADIRASFTREQIDALRVAFGARTWGQHPLDLRGTLNLWRWRYYYVLLAGRNRRDLTRREQQLSALIRAVLVAGFLTFSTLTGLLVLYLLKSAAGIDIFPGFSLGIWHWFKAEFLL